MKPLIGISCNYSTDPSISKNTFLGLPGQTWHLVAHEYIHAIQRQGGIPVLIPVYQGTGHVLEDIAQVVGQLDGLIISGGEDVNPEVYGERITAKCGEINPIRDAFESLLVRHVLEHSDIPVLGICRGIQITTAVMGGTLYQDLESSGFPNHTLLMAPFNHPTHLVNITEGSRLHQILGQDTLMVPSIHHQGVKDVAPGFRVAARAEDGLVESIELPGDRFMLACQWHSEMIYDSETHQRIFKAFVAACRENM